MLHSSTIFIFHISYFNIIVLHCYVYMGVWCWSVSQLNGGKHNDITDVSCLSLSLSFRSSRTILLHWELMSSSGLWFSNQVMCLVFSTSHQTAAFSVRLAAAAAAAARKSIYFCKWSNDLMTHINRNENKYTWLSSKLHIEFLLSLTLSISLSPFLFFHLFSSLRHFFRVVFNSGDFS